MDTIEEGIRAHPALNAFEMSLWRKKDRPPLPSAKYLDLARRHVRHGATKGPSVEEGRQIARVLLAPFMRVALWETDWDMERYVRRQAVDWLGSRDLTELRYYFLASELSPPAWDTLKAICRYLVLRGEEDIPTSSSCGTPGPTLASAHALRRSRLLVIVSESWVTSSETMRFGIPSTC